MEVRFLDLHAQYKQLKPQIDALFADILRQGVFVGGEWVGTFESNFAAFTQTQGCVGVGNGTDALEIALKALDLKPKSEIILPANTFFASLEAVLNSGHKAVLVDCNADYLIDTNSLQEALTPNSAAIMPVHLYGRACDMGAIMDIARRYSLKVIEDCAQAHGAQSLWEGEPRSVGSIGDVGCFSFYPGKNLGAYGDGGGIVSKDPKIVQKCRSLANHGIQNNKYDHRLIGRNSRLDTLQAGILNIKLQALKTANATRAKIAKLYEQGLSQFDGIKTPASGGFIGNHVWHLYVICLVRGWEGKRDIVMEYLQKNGIQCLTHYPKDLSSLEVVASHPDCRIFANTNAVKYAQNIISLPMGEHITQDHIQYICEKFGALQKLEHI
ncbi:hypothetical protein BKH46_06585 [Helicobacter sp. 12S02634-8]|nr:hypothetical protein BKH46_06585 [Helicobacter sp. 12S02634-8]